MDLYNSAKKYWKIKSHVIYNFFRSSAVFNVFIINLPQVLDQNHNMGLFMIQPILTILQNSPCPPLKTVLVDHYSLSCSLWHLETHCRRSWLMALLVILYKVKYIQLLMLLLKNLWNNKIINKSKSAHQIDISILKKWEIKSKSTKMAYIGRWKHLCCLYE